MIFWEEPADIGFGICYDVMDTVSVGTMPLREAHVMMVAFNVWHRYVLPKVLPSKLALEIAVLRCCSSSIHNETM